MEHVPILAAAILLAWASGINSYATLLRIGLLHAWGVVTLPTGLQPLGAHLLITAVGTLYAMQFCADKIAGIDFLWDGVHTLVRIPLGAALAVATVTPAHLSLSLAIAVLGAVVAAASHLAKTGARLLGNRYYTRWRRWAKSLLEDAAVVVIVSAALQVGSLSVVLLTLLMVLTCRCLLRLWRRAWPVLSSAPVAPEAGHWGLSRVGTAIVRLANFGPEGDVPVC
jgi:hypothetical protein